MEQEEIEMTEWNVVLILGTLVSLGVALVKPIVSLNTSITKLTMAVDRLQMDLSEQTAHNAESHRRIWDHNETQDDRLEDHEHRIVQLEGK